MKIMLPLIFRRKEKDMADYKKGGGGKEQLYSEENGEYIRNPQCELDEENIVMSKVFGLKDYGPIAYPDPNVHDMDYCELFMAYCLDFRYPLLDDKKITGYLLLFHEVDDKLKFLNALGYSMDNWRKFGEKLLKGTSFKSKIVTRFNQYGINFKTETILFDLINLKNVSVTTVWHIEKDFSVRFVTLIPEEFKK